IVAPPNYAPEVEGVRTMYDLIFDSFVQAGRLPFPAIISFTQDIYPILRRLCELQWVNQGYAVNFGVGGWQNFLAPSYLAGLASKAAEQRELRQQVFNQFGSYERDGAAPWPWPWLYGDAMNVPAAATPRQHVALEPTQYRMLEKWAAGQFTADWTG